MEQMNFFGQDPNKRIKVLELFGGIGAPRKALENIFGEETIKSVVCRNLTFCRNGLMGFTDKDYAHMIRNGITEQQVSFLAGNSICIPVLEAIYRQLMAIGVI